MCSDAAKRSLAVFPAGCNGEFDLPPELATVISSGEGCELRTASGDRMLDFSMGWGSVLLGHAREEVREAIVRRAGLGTNFAYVTDASLELAEEIVRVSPACEAVRFCASGTEATMYCLRLAKAFTGRRKVLKFEGAYHGAHDVGVTSLFPPPDSEHVIASPSSHGVNTDIDGSVVVAPFNDLAAVEQRIDECGSELAAVIVEPLQRCIPPAKGFLEGLREVSRRRGVMLVFDEVVTGFRLAYGGAQEYYGVTPDLVAYGKALGGGLPIGAYGGRRDVMELVCEDRMGHETYVWTASTLGGNPLSTAAASATLQVLRGSGVYERLHKLGAYLRSQMSTVLKEAGLTARVVGDGPIGQIIFGKGEPVDYRSSQHEDKQLARRLMLELFRRGVFLNPMGTKLYLSLAHTEAHCDQFCEILTESLAEVRAVAV